MDSVLTLTVVSVILTVVGTGVNFGNLLIMMLMVVTGNSRYDRNSSSWTVLVCSEDSAVLGIDRWVVLN